MPARAESARPPRWGRPWPITNSTAGPGERLSRISSHRNQSQVVKVMCAASWSATLLGQRRSAQLEAMRPVRQLAEQTRRLADQQHAKAMPGADPVDGGEQFAAARGLVTE